jgi:hypothetical protein
VTDGTTRLLAILEELGWQVHHEPGSRLLSWAFRGRHGEWFGQTWWLDHAEQLLVYSICPLSVPEAARREVERYVACVNRELVVGSFETEDDGQLRLRTSLGLAADELTPSLVRRALDANVTTMDHYLPGVVRIVVGGQSADEARAAVHASADDVAAVG